MSIFEGKSPAERNKIIAAIVLGVLAIVSLGYTFGGSFFRGKTKVTVDASASPTASATPTNNQNAQNQILAPNEEEVYKEYTVVPVIYRGGIDPGPIGGRNIFAFYEPGLPTPRPSYTPTQRPIVTITPTPYIPPPTPTPPPIIISFLSPQSVYQGSKTFRLQVSGDKFTPETKIVFNGNVLQTTFVNAQNLYADVSTSLVQNASNFTVYVDTFDGKNFSNQVSFIVQAPPKPQIEYIGMIARKHYNNDTAYFQKNDKDEPVGKRLGDEIEGRFKLVSISEKEVEFVDKFLGFRHKISMKRPDGTSSSGNTFTKPDTIRNSPINRQRIPGIPDNLPISTPNPNIPNPTRKDNFDD